jgi:IPT/TIG domain-containing protein
MGSHFAHSERTLLKFATLLAAIITLSFNLAAQTQAAVAIVSLSVNSPTVPPGGTLQMQVSVTEPNPILKGKQGIGTGCAAAVTALLRCAAVSPTLATVPSVVTLNAIRDAAVFSPAGDVSGVAVTAGGSPQIFFSSPLSTFGTTIDTPVFVIAYPVASTAKVGQTVNLTLDPTSSLWYNPKSKLYPVELKSGVLTVGGTISISDVTPSAGTIQPGTVISVKGIGFDTSTKVDINEATIATTQFINSKLIQVTLSAAAKIRGQRVRVTNSKNETATYYPYPRTTAVGKSTHALIASSIPLFAETSWLLGYFHPTLQGKIFTGLALQNLNSKMANIVLKLTSKNGSLLSTYNLALKSNNSISRDLAEFFPGSSPATGTTVSVSSDQPIQMMGMLADDGTNTVLSLDPTPTP